VYLGVRSRFRVALGEARRFARGVRDSVHGCTPRQSGHHWEALGGCTTCWHHRSNLSNLAGHDYSMEVTAVAQVSRGAL